MVHILPGRPAGKPDQMSPIDAAVPVPAFDRRPTSVASRSRTPAPFGSKHQPPSPCRRRLALTTIGDTRPCLRPSFRLVPPLGQDA